MFKLPRPEASVRVAQLEGPEEVARLLEVGAHGVDLVDEILHAHDPVFAQVVLDDLVVREGDALLVDLAVAALVDELAHGLEVGVAVGDVGFDDLEHFRRGFCEAHEDAVVDLEEAEELERFAWFGRHLRDTGCCQHVKEGDGGGRQCENVPFDTDDEDKLGLSRDVVAAILFAQTSETNLLAFCIAVLLDVGFGALEDNSTFFLPSL